MALASTIRTKEHMAAVFIERTGQRQNQQDSLCSSIITIIMMMMNIIVVKKIHCVRKILAYLCSTDGTTHSNHCVVNFRLGHFANCTKIRVVEW